MRILAVGDIQGCYDCLRRLLDTADFNPDRDQLWCVGDLVNRGPNSLATLRFLRGLGSHCRAVLGNHDIHLLRNITTKTPPPPTMRQITTASDCAELIEWLRHRPLLHLDSTIGWAMVHAGLHPHWSIPKAIKRAHRINKILQSDHWQQQLPLLQPVPETQASGKNTKLAFALSVFTRARFCSEEGVFNWHNNNDQPDRKEDAPWFAHPNARWQSDPYRIVFGHWASKGVINDQSRVLGLDSGCVWGKRLTLAQLNTSPLKFWSVACQTP